MRNLNVNPTTYDEYVTANLDEDEAVYRITFGDGVDEAFAILENDESFEDFEDEVRAAIRRKHGRRTIIRSFEDVTGVLDWED